MAREQSNANEILSKIRSSGGNKLLSSMKSNPFMPSVCSDGELADDSPEKLLKPEVLK